MVRVPEVARCELRSRRAVSNKYFLIIMILTKKWQKVIYHK